MMEHIKGSAPTSVTFAATACLLSLLVLMGLKLRWFRARMSFDEPTTSQPSTYAGVYRSNYSDEVFDYRRPSVQTPAVQTSAPGPRAVTNAAVASTSTAAIATTASVNKAKDVKTKEPKQVKQKESKEVKQKEAKEVKQKDTKVKEIKSKDPKVKDEKTSLFAFKTKEPKVKDETPKELKVKDVKTKEPKVKETKTKDPKVKETKAKDPKVKDVKVKNPKAEVANVRPASKTQEQAINSPQVSSQMTQNNAFPFMQPPKYDQEPPRQAQQAAQDKIFTFAPPKAPQLPNGTPQPMKTFGLTQPSRGQIDPMISPIPQQGQRAIRNPAALGMDTYKSPNSFYETQTDNYYSEINGVEDRGKQKVSDEAQYLYDDMDEESET